MPLRRSLSLSFCLATVLLLAGCSDEAGPEAQIRALIDAGEQAAEARSVGDIEELLHRDFRDGKGNTATSLRRLLTGWFFRHKNIHLLTRIDSIELLSPTRAEVGLYAAMAGSAISDAASLASLRARVYRFDLTLIRDDEWRVLRAAYGPARLTDLQ